MQAESISSSAPIKLHKCNDGKLQAFKLDKKGRIPVLSDSTLCLTIDQRKSKNGRGGSPVHLKRNLTLERCTDRLKPYQIWGKREIDQTLSK